MPFLPVRRLTAALLLVAVPAAAHAQPSLSGVTLFNSSATGSSTGGYWNTVAGDGAYNVFLTQTPDANFTAGAVINGSIPVPGVDNPGFVQGLNVGSNVFYFYAATSPSASFGLNLFFGAAPTTGMTNPGISAVANAADATFGAVGAGACTLTQAITCAAANGGLSFVSGAYTVTLTDYRILSLAGASQSPDRVQAFYAIPDGPGDNYGTFTLNVVDANANAAVVPEPGTWALMATGLAGLAGVAARRRRS